MTLRYIEIVLTAEPPNTEAVNIRFRGVDPDGIPFMNELTDVSQEELGASVLAELTGENHTLYGIYDDSV
jgi:hypothetical protein